jgi:hypothetical protein
MATTVGLIRLEDGNAQPLATVHCSAPKMMRPIDVRFGGRVYHQNHVDPDGVWVYRAFFLASGGTVEDDPTITLVELAPDAT